MTRAALIYPHQLYEHSPALQGVDRAYLVEDPLFFRQYAFHRQKLHFHRLTMQSYADQLRSPVEIVSAHTLQHSGDIVRQLQADRISEVQFVDLNDDWLEQRLTSALQEQRIRYSVLEDPGFLTSRTEMERYTTGKKRFFFTDFYIQQRKRLGILLEEDASPIGGKWSYDTDNRKKLPASVRPPALPWPRESDRHRSTRQSVQRDFPDAPGRDDVVVYPTTHREARRWLNDFLEHRLNDFGPYEDAISQRERYLFHSLLSPMLNVGLLTPHDVVEATLPYADRIPLNSLEGFLRQVIGWREFVRLIYHRLGRQQRTRNYWGYTLPMPASCYTARTGIEPVDHTIRSILETGYCHHIERLMILGNFFLLCEVAPDEVYRWFMELFIDAYDWVMVPNVYGMSQFADGGRMTTKPYISGSSYIRKMSDFKSGDWCPIWDALYWRFIDRHADFFRKNPRMAMMVKMKEKLGKKLDSHLKIAEQFLEDLHQSE